RRCPMSSSRAGASGSAWRSSTASAPPRSGTSSSPTARGGRARARRARPCAWGVPVPGSELAIGDDEGHPVARGEIGNLRVKGDSTMAYYWNKHDKTKETLFGSTVHTDHKNSRDKDGYFWY